MERNFESEKYKKVKKRIDEIKKFYKHFSVYLIINLFFIGRRIYKDIDRGNGVIDALTDLDNYNFFFWWGVALILHGILVFGAPKIFSKDWEDRKIKELMNK
jgi:hypothetical protein